ncbi:glycosyltransferase [Alloalcanivorax xenomutans]|uniref:glycosyltransferase n=1 Tax=Alloalcanivorax xenomutans TaxID=1094342 RepID=UPI001F2568B0|nr:glycosyltransferase [Alloalcanivorax xenomutans]MCE7523545.1 glycosyltransferase [Alloalcanivorax xenomutans]WOA33125.1 glycosyltransferase [Alloalcanivorax xenomutans]
MLIVIDMQGAQSGSRLRGIGRYTLMLVKAMVHQQDTHEIVLALNGSFSDTIESLRAEFDGLLPQENIRVWHPAAADGKARHGDGASYRLTELTYEGFLVNQDPDFIYVTSLFEGLGEGAITCIHRLQKQVPVAVTIFDLIPYIKPKPYLDDPTVRRWYLEKIENLKRADVWLGISESARNEGIEHLNLSEDRVYNISSAADDAFQKITISPEQERKLRDKYGLKKPYVMYTGGIDYRKNIEGLIRSYARLPAAIRKDHQLAIVCSVRPENRVQLEKLAHKEGMEDSELVLTGFVPEQDLVALYNLCKLFVFPSLHEGFGLPALEAIQCGAPVIAANTSSLPEVVGWEEALFDPYSDESIATLIKRGLSDQSFCDEARLRQSEHAKKFSWGGSARAALSAMEDWYNCPDSFVLSSEVPSERPLLAYVSPLSPVRSGIADYSAELLPELSKYYDIELIVDQPKCDLNPSILNGKQLRSPEWLIQNADKVDRVLYHFGNSSFHRHMFKLLDKVPGVVVLHDFFLSGAQAYREMDGLEPNAYALALYHSHGYQALRERFDSDTGQDVVWHYPANLPVLQRAQGLIVHSEHSFELARDWYGEKARNDWTVIPHLRTLDESMDRERARQDLGFNAGDLIVCSFGVLGRTKQNHRLLKAWLDSPLSRNPHAHLIFVGQNSEDEYGRFFAKSVARSGSCNHIKITGWADAKMFQQYLAAADIGVQLRTLSRGETSGTVLDCMGKGLATIINKHGSMSDIDSTGVWMLPDEFKDEELLEALTTLADNVRYRQELGAQAREIIRHNNNPAKCAKQYHEAIEKYHCKSSIGLTGLVEKVALELREGADLVPWAANLSANFAPTPRPKQLLVDVSDLVQGGDQCENNRVAQALLKGWLRSPPSGYQVQPVYGSKHKEGYWYARTFTLDLLDLPACLVFDEPVEVWEGDLFISLDSQPHVITSQRVTLEDWHRRGVTIWFMIYDLLPLLTPEPFVSTDKDIYAKWFNTVCQFDGVTCISRAVADDFSAYMERLDIERERPINVEWFHLGAGVSGTSSNDVISSQAQLVLDSMATSPSFLMVGTIESRKGHTQVLDTFEQLWADGISAHLFIVGKGVEAEDQLTKRLSHHPQLNKRLFWLDDIGDKCLEEAYSRASCLIAASYGEGGRLPLIEAAKYGLPIFARDIPPFKEVAGNHAFYFEGESTDDLGEAVKQWLDLYAKNQHPASNGIPWLTWEESARELLSLIIPDVV